MKYHKRILGAMIGVLIIVAAFGFTRQDDDPIKKIIDQVNKWATQRPVEKVYLHLDKPFYAVGDDIWFKAYVTVGALHQLSDLSKVLNIELIDGKDSVKQAVKLPLLSGLAYGDFAVPDTLKPGNYRIRAYTNYMRNAGDDYFFDKTITIGSAINNNVFTKTNYEYSTVNGQQKVNALITYTNLDGSPYAAKNVSYEVQLDFRSVLKGKGITDDKGSISVSFVNPTPAVMKTGRIITSIKIADKQIVGKVIAIKATTDKIAVQFFPESGWMINGVRSKIAFKALGADGLGADIKGVITDDANNEVAKLSSPHCGMGVFSLFPEKGKTYKATLTYPDGSTGTVNLPQAVDKGYVLSISNADPDKLVVHILPSRAVVEDSLHSDFCLIAHAGGVVCYAAKSKVTTSAFTAVIPKSRFPSGIVQFTLFSGSGEPLNERVVFIQNPDQLKLKVASANATYAPRQKVNIDLNAKDKDDKPVVGSFSVSVIDETKVVSDESEESTIMSNILLTSDLKGYIEKPNYYFTAPSAQTRADLDVLMLTQGYRRFEWKQILNDVFSPQVFQPEKSLSISGTIKTSGGKPIPNGKVMLLATKGGPFILDTVSDSQGNFKFNNLVFKDSIRFAIQARTGKNRRDVEIELDNIIPQIVTKNKNAPDLQVNISDGLVSYLKNSKNNYNEELKYGLGNHSTMLKEVTITEKKKPVLENSSNLNGAGNADQVIKSDQLGSYPTLSDALQGRAFGVVFKNGQAYSTRSMNTPMLIVVDGMSMQPDFLDQLNPNDVEGVEVLRTIGNLAIYGSQGSGGVLVITTKRGGGDASYQRYAPGIITYAPKGYYKAREFYSPDYESPKTNTHIADLRTTVFWKPNIVTDKDGHASFSYFNADGKGTCKVVVEGIDADGNLGRQVYRYKVE